MRHDLDQRAQFSRCTVQFAQFPWVPLHLCKRSANTSCKETRGSHTAEDVAQRCVQRQRVVEVGGGNNTFFGLHSACLLRPQATVIAQLQVHHTDTTMRKGVSLQSLLSLSELMGQAALFIAHEASSVSSTALCVKTRHKGAQLTLSTVHRVERKITACCASHLCSQRRPQG
jgi:ABC-type dipeptide/oligopeptide/nickel transport system ATPase subunit